MDEIASRIREAYPDWPDYVADWKAESIVQMDADILRAITAGNIPSEDDPAGMLARIQCPVLLLQADPLAGGILPDDFVAEVVPENGRWTVVKIEGAGHNINREHPEKLLPVVMPWLEAIWAE